MNNSMINAMVSMNGLQQKLDIIANNIANVDTTGYKRKEATFEDILTNVKSQPEGFQKEGRLTPLGFTQGWGAKLSQVQTSLSQGSLQPTGNPTDLAIEGDGLFELSVYTEDEQGNRVPNPTPVFTRDGAFQLTVMQGDTENAYLATKDGYLVKGMDDEPIKIPKGYQFSVDATGIVSAYNGSKPEAGSTPVGQLKVMRVLRPQFLQEVGDNMFTIPAGLTAANISNILQPAGQGSPLEQSIHVRQGFLEQSNVNLGDEMTDMMTVQRAFQLSSKALSSADQMMNLANNLRS